MLSELRDFVAEHGLLAPSDRVLVGLSGGADSVCLLHLLRAAGYAVVAAHLNHGQRPEADEDEAACAAFCEELQIPFVSGKADVPKVAQDLKIGLEEAGRKTRYAFFEEAAASSGCNRIATAHTLSDHAETILWNLARGTGLAGLAGIPSSRGDIVRPIRFATREQTERYCAEHGLPIRSDSTNDDLRYARVRIRKRILPELAEVHSNYLGSIVRLSKIAEEENRFLDGASAAALEQGEIPLNGRFRFLSLEAEAAFRTDYLRHLPPVLLKRALRLVAELLGGALDFAQTEHFAHALCTTDKGALTTDRDAVRFTWDRERAHFQIGSEEAAFRSPLPVPGETRSSEHGWRLVLSVADAWPEPSPRDAWCVQLDPDAFRGPLHFRSAAAGDEMRPIGGTGHRKLSDLLSESGLTLLARRRLPILCDIIGPLWAPGVTLDERARLVPGARRALQAEFGPISPPGGIAETEITPQTYANK